VGREDHRRPPRNLVELLDEHRAAPLELGDDVGVVDDLLAHVDRRAAVLERALYNLNGSFHAGARRARGGEQDLAGAERLRPVVDQRAGAAERPVGNRGGGDRAQRPVQLVAVRVEHDPEGDKRLGL
jgi:hypothetical protein